METKSNDPVSSNLIKFPANRSIFRSCFRDERESKITLVSDFCVSIVGFINQTICTIFVELVSNEFYLQLEILLARANITSSPCAKFKRRAKKALYIDSRNEGKLCFFVKILYCANSFAVLITSY